MENSQDYGSQVSGNYSVDDNTVGFNDVVNSLEDNVVYVNASGGSKGIMVELFTIGLQTQKFLAQHLLITLQLIMVELFIQVQVIKAILEI